jgi:hypothetical protein
MRNLPQRSCLARVLSSPLHRHSAASGTGLPGHCCRRLTRKFVSGKGSQASVFSGPGSGRRVRSRRQGPDFRPCPHAAHDPTAACFLFDTALILPSRRERSGLSHTNPSRDAKRMPTTIRNARPVRCQGGQAPEGGVEPTPPFIEPLRIGYPLLIKKGVIWRHEAFRRA